MKDLLLVNIRIKKRVVLNGRRNCINNFVNKMLSIKDVEIDETRFA